MSVPLGLPKDEAPEARISRILQAILTKADDGLSHKVWRKVISPGTPAWDDCGCSDETGDGGLLTLHVISIEPVYSGSSSGSSAGCGPAMWRYTAALGVYRCVSTLDDDGLPPSEFNVTQDGLSVIRDMAELRAVLACELPEITGVMRASLGDWTPADPQGGCAGGQWTASFLTGG